MQTENEKQKKENKKNGLWDAMPATEITLKSMKKKPEKPPAEKKPVKKNPIYKMPLEEIIKRGLRVKPPNTKKRG